MILLRNTFFVTETILFDNKTVNIQLYTKQKCNNNYETFTPFIYIYFIA